MKDGLGFPDSEAWNMIEKIAEKNNLGYKQLVSVTISFRCSDILGVHLLKLGQLSSF